jgi:hypothetical protein
MNEPLNCAYATARAWDGVRTMLFGSVFTGNGTRRPKRVIFATRKASRGTSHGVHRRRSCYYNKIIIIIIKKIARPAEQWHARPGREKSRNSIIAARVVKINNPSGTAATTTTAAMTTMTTREIRGEEGEKRVRKTSSNNPQPHFNSNPLNVLGGVFLSSSNYDTIAPRQPRRFVVIIIIITYYIMSRARVPQSKRNIAISRLDPKTPCSVRPRDHGGIFDQPHNATTSKLKTRIVTDSVSNPPHHHIHPRSMA